MNLSKLLAPNVIALIGASKDRNKIGNSILRNILNAKYRGRIIPINPKERSVEGKKTYASVLDVAGSIDLAVIAVPAAIVPNVLRDCGTKRIPFVVIISAGFAEAGPNGKRLDFRIRSIAQKFHIRILGPNCLGIINTSHRLNASFASGYPLAGNVSFISQSGAMLVSLVDWSLRQGIGLGTLVSLGNAAGIKDYEVLDALARDTSTDAIGMYIEEVSEPRKLLLSLQKWSKIKPIIILKAGASQAGIEAITSHTGSLAGSHEVVSAAFRQAGAIQVTDLEELFNVLALYASPARNSSSDIVVVTNAGGPGIVAADEIAKTDLKLAVIPERLQKRLRFILNRRGEIHNPIDLVGDANFEIFKKTIDALLREPSFGNILVMVTPQTVTPIENLARYIGRVNKKSGKHILSCFIGGKRVEAAHQILSSCGTSNFTFPYDAIHTLALSKKFFAPRERFTTEISPGNHETGGAFLSYETVQRYISRRGLPFMKGVVLKKASEINKIRTYPIAMKALSKRTLHKARNNAIRLNVVSRESAEMAYAELSSLFSGSGFEGILAQPMVSGGREFFVGVKRDPQFGLVTLFGIGGTLTEELHDIVLRIGLISQNHVRTMLAELRNQHLLDGCDLRFITKLLLAINAMAARDAKLLELDCNPVLVFREGGTIIDVRIKYATK